MLTIGVDLAQSRDRTALVALETFKPELEVSVEQFNQMNTVNRALRGRVRMPRSQLHHQISHIQRFPPGISYPEQVTALLRAADALSTEEQARLVIDATGVGRPVVDMVRQACDYPVTAVTITGGSEVVKSGRNAAVPKTDLVGCVEVVLSTRRLHCEPGLPHSADLDHELRSFGYEMSPTGRPKYAGKGAHDDLVTALSLALWGSERGVGTGAAFKEFMRRDSARRRGYPDQVYG